MSVSLLRTAAATMCVKRKFQAIMLVIKGRADTFGKVVEVSFLKLNRLPAIDTSDSSVWQVFTFPLIMNPIAIVILDYGAGCNKLVKNSINSA